MGEFNVDNAIDTTNYSKFFYVSGKSFWALLLSTILVLTLWKNYHGILTVVLSVIVLYQSHVEENKSKIRARYLFGLFLFALFGIFANGKEVIIKFSKSDMFNLPLWLFPYFVVIASSGDTFNNIENFSF